LNKELEHHVLIFVRPATFRFDGTGTFHEI